MKQYITLGRSELFFADKTILIEGDTERMLLSAMMDKTDSKYKHKGNYVPLLSQNISIIEVGAYSHIFATFLGFIGIKTLIITDLDCAEIKDNGRASKCAFVEASTTTNASIKKFLDTDNLQNIIEISKNPILFSYDEPDSNWSLRENGNMRLLFQVEENGYQPRSFEDSFVCNNLQFIFLNKEKFVSLKTGVKSKKTLLIFMILLRIVLPAKPPLLLTYFYMKMMITIIGKFHCILRRD